MAAYVMALGKIHDQQGFSKYLECVPATLEAYGGQLLGLEEPAEVLEGEAPYPRLVLLKFSSKERAREWKNSHEFKEAQDHRHNLHSAHAHCRELRHEVWPDAGAGVAIAIDAPTILK